jgi:uncharacterized damage-inducible protein DinB
MSPEEARELYAYTKWANAAMFDAAAGLPLDALTAPAPASFPSVVSTLGHIVSAEWIWLRRWLGDAPTAAPVWVASTDLAELRARLSEIETQRDAFLTALTAADLDRLVSYRTLAGAPHADPLGVLLRHVANHSTYHRGQLSAQLRQLGHTPPSTDLIAFAWTR